jgi:hypothetical protein
VTVRPIDIAHPPGIEPTISVDLGGVAIRLTLRWLPRARRFWYIVETPHGVPLTPAALAAPSAVIPFDPTDPRSPRGRLQWAGPEPYGRGELRLLWEEPEAPPARRTLRQIRAATTRGAVTFDSTEVTWDSTAVTFDVLNGAT